MPSLRSTYSITKDEFNIYSLLLGVFHAVAKPRSQVADLNIQTYDFDNEKCNKVLANKFFLAYFLAVLLTDSQLIMNFFIPI